MTEPLLRGGSDPTSVTYPTEVGLPGAPPPLEPIAPPTAGVGLPVGDEHGLSGQTKSQTRIVLGRFFHQPLAVFGLVARTAVRSTVFDLIGMARKQFGGDYRRARANA